ncbi:MAG: hypothetical protein Rhims3KO_18330 [Hyphomicrobiales bacterium]
MSPIDTMTVSESSSAQNLHVQERSTCNGIVLLESCGLSSHEAADTSIRPLTTTNAGLEAIEASFATAHDDQQTDGAQSSRLGYAPSDEATITEDSADHRLKVWFEDTFAYYDGRTLSGSIWTQEAGIDYIWNNRFLIGVMGRYDTGTFDDFSTNGTFDGEGVTAGVRMGTLLGLGMTLDGYLSYTWLEYESEAGTLSAATQARRMDASVNLAGQYAISEDVTLEPNARYTYTREQQDAYRWSNGLPIAASTTSSGVLSVGSGLRYSFNEASGGSLSVYVSAHGDYDFAIEKGQSSTPLPTLDDVWSARLGIGMNGALSNGISVSLEGEIDRLGADAYTRYTGTARISIPLN